MNTRQYYYLTTIAGFGNLSHAAQALRVSPSALSKFLSECERNFGSPLFLRYGRRLYPTAVGQDVIDAAQRILDEQSLFDFFIKVLFITLLKCYPIFRAYLKTPQRCPILPERRICCVAFACIPQKQPRRARPADEAAKARLAQRSGFRKRAPSRAAKIG